MVKASAGHKMASCTEQDRSRRSMLQAKMALFDVKCEEMCKKLGAFPDCQCPGFAGNPPSGGDTRKCVDQYCQDPKTPCPTDGFVTCVSEATKLDLLQWQSLAERMTNSLDMYRNMFRNVTASK